MSLRDERNPPPEPTPLTAEESTKEIRTLKGTTTALWVVLILAVVGLSLVQVFNRPHLPVVHHPNATDSLRIEVAALEDTVLAFGTKTETGQLKQVLARFKDVEEAATQAGIDARRAESEVTQHRLTGK